MSRFNYENSENYNRSGSSTGYFKLANDGDTARVRFMYNSIDDIEGFSVHQVELPDGRHKYVNCIREYDEPIDNCPLCKAGYKTMPKLFLALYNEDDQTVQVWERGVSFYKKLNGLCKRHKPLVGSVVELERNGKKGDTKTTYETYDEDNDETTLEDLPEAPEILGTLVLNKDYDELQNFVDTGDFESSGRPTRRNRDNEEDEDERPHRPTGRRTPKGRGF